MDKKFNDLMNIYIQCVKKAISEALSASYGEKWFDDLKSRDTSRDHSSLERYSSIEELDFQACNKVLLYDMETWNAICKHYHHEQYFKKKEDKPYKASYKKYVDALFSLIQYRNDFQGHNSYSKESEEKSRSECMHAVENMRFILNDIFPTVQSSCEDKLYISLFQEQSLHFFLEGEKKKYYLMDYLSPQIYEYDRFFLECAKMGIDAQMEDGQEIFYSSHLEADLQKLKNLLRRKQENSKPLSDEIDEIGEKKITAIEVPAELIEGNPKPELLSIAKKYWEKNRKLIVGIALIVVVIVGGVYITTYALSLLDGKLAGNEKEDTNVEVTLKCEPKGQELWCYADLSKEKGEEIQGEKLSARLKIELSDGTERTVKVVFELMDFGIEDEKIQLQMSVPFEELKIEEGVTIQKVKKLGIEFQ